VRRSSWRQFINKNGVVYIDGKVLQLPERAKPQFSYSVVLDGKTPIDFEYLLQLTLLVIKATYKTLYCSEL
jgi:signal peptidase I